MSEDRGTFYQQKLSKMQRLEELGVDVFGARYDCDLKIAQIKDDFKESDPVKIVGRIMAYRGHGKSVFMDVKDMSGKMQVYVKKNIIGDEQFEIIDNLEVGDIIGVEGETFLTHKGEPTIRVDSFTVLSKSLLTLPEKWHGLKDVETRYRQRYVDLIVNDDVRDIFLLRSKIIRQIRAFLDGKDFLEVETPMMQHIAGGATARPFETFHHALGVPLYLRIAPELFLKRLIVGGLERVYELNRNFRNEGISRRHNPEFTMLEVYQSYADYEVMMDLTEELISGLAKMVWGSTKKEMKDGNELDFTPPWPRITLKASVIEACGVDFTSVENPEKAARDLNIDIEDGMTRDQILTQAFETLVEHNLYRPTFVTHYPASLCPLAKTCDDDHSLTARFELFVRGQELANAYSELNDPIEQRKRFLCQLDGAEDKKQLDEDFVRALEYGMPPAGGLGIGVDRLVMALTDSDSIRDVILFPQLKPEQFNP